MAYQSFPYEHGDRRQEIPINHFLHSHDRVRDGTGYNECRPKFLIIDMNVYSGTASNLRRYLVFFWVDPLLSRSFPGNIFYHVDLFWVDLLLDTPCSPAYNSFLCLLFEHGRCATCHNFALKSGTK